MLQKNIRGIKMKKSILSLLQGFLLFFLGGVSMLEAQKINDGFIFIKGATYTMGSPEQERMRSKDEKQHTVTISDFYISPYETSQKEYQKVTGSNPSFFKGENLPVESVSWYEAIQYCNKKSICEDLPPCYTIKDNGKIVEWDTAKQGYRLPTEAEWEVAHRAGTTSVFLTPNYTTSHEANFYGCYPYLIEENYLRHTNKDVVTGPVRDKTIKVNELSPNAFGLYNTAGNVSEWCFDLYGEYKDKEVNPTGQKEGYLRVNRGGGFNDFGKHIRSAYRSCANALSRDRNTGFRLARGALNAGIVTTTWMGEPILPQKPRVLVAYFSYSGNTKKAAQMIAQKIGADIEEIQMKNEYRGNIYDVSGKDLIQEALPPLKNKKIEAAKYDVIILGYPTWWATIPRPVVSFLVQNDFSDKTILIFSSHGGTIFGESISDAAKIANKCYIKDAFEFNYSGGSNLNTRLDEWLKKNLPQ